MKNAYNPYLPSWEYVPDVEPRVFEGRLYVYGSHDLAHGTTYCEEDYVGWSASPDDLANWKYEGVIYRKDQDKGNLGGEKKMFAPDVVQGSDGKYYLYYGMSDVKYIGIAVSDSPAGPFSYYGQVRNSDGSYPAGLAFDPGVYVEGKQVYLYYGFAPSKKDLENSKFRALGKPMLGSYMVQLGKDMKTVITAPVLVANGDISAEGTSFEKHPFFEASSMRKIGDKYYYIYSSLWGHELCYAIGDMPEGPFKFGGVIVSNGDIGIHEKAVAYEANNHGSIVEIQGTYYIFYHRHTHGTHFSRQGCAERIQIRKDGSIPQVEITSCGLNQGALPAAQEHPAYIMCNLHGPKGACKIPSKPPYDETVPYMEETRELQKADRILYLHNMRTGAACGVKYLEFAGETTCELTLRGEKGTILIYLDQEQGEPIGKISVADVQNEWKTFSGKIKATHGIHAVYFVFDMEKADAAIDLLKFKFC